jgi:single-strand DNA-binding protein
MSKTNSVRLIGHLGQDPKLVSNGENSSVVSFSLATNETYKDAQGNKATRTEWHNIVAFGRVANLIIQYCKRGEFIMLNGRLQTRQYTNKEGQQRYVTEIIAEEILFLGGKKSEGSTQNEPMMISAEEKDPF